MISAAFCSPKVRIEGERKRNGLLLHIRKRSRINDFLINHGIKDPGIFPSRNNIRSEKTKKYNQGKQDHWIQRMKGAFFLLFIDGLTHHKHLFFDRIVFRQHFILGHSG